MLIDQLKQSYQQMAVNNPSGNPKNSLKAQYQQIKWYIDNQHYLQATYFDARSNGKISFGQSALNTPKIDKIRARLIYRK